jgi:hypothetical protein
MILESFITFALSIERPPRYNWNIVESGAKHHKPSIERLNVWTR